MQPEQSDEGKQQVRKYHWTHIGLHQKVTSLESEGEKLHKLNNTIIKQQYQGDLRLTLF